jgi:hypothetical protein
MRIFRIALALFLSIVAVACAQGQPVILESKDVQFFKVFAYKVEGNARLHLSGLAFHSALAVEKLEQEESGEVLHLKVVLVPAKKGLSGTFDYTVDIPSTVAYVAFGNSETVIWRRAVTTAMAASPASLPLACRAWPSATTRRTASRASPTAGTRR